MLKTSFSLFICYLFLVRPVCYVAIVCTDVDVMMVTEAEGFG